MRRVLNKEEVERVPFSFWHHLASPPGPRPDLFRGLEDEEVYNRVIEGHKKMYETMNPDFMKLMSDGFFGHPSLREIEVNEASDLYKVKSVGPDHPWITEQVKFVKTLNDMFHDEVYTFYTIFSPVNSIRLHFQSFEGDASKFPRLFLEDPEAMNYAAEQVAIDTKILVEKIFEEVDLDGIFYSVQEVQDDRADEEFHNKYVAPTDKDVIETINKFSNANMLHICGYKQYTNNLNLFKDYDIQIMNWATYTEKVSLSEGREFFGDKIVCGGFNNNIGDILDAGTDEEVEQQMKELLVGAGTKELIIGADCTVNPEIPAERYALIKELCIKYSGK